MALSLANNVKNNSLPFLHGKHQRTYDGWMLQTDDESMMAGRKQHLLSERPNNRLERVNNRIEEHENRCQRDNIISHWKDVIRIIEPQYLLMKLRQKHFFLNEGSFLNLGDMCKQHQAYLVLIAVYRELECRKTYDDFIKILRSMMEGGNEVAKILDDHVTEVTFPSITEEDIELHTVEVSKHRHLLEKTLKYEVLMDVLGDFIQSFIFSIDNTENVICKLPHQRNEAYVRFVDTIIQQEKLKLGSYQCLLKSIESTKSNKRIFREFLEAVKCDTTNQDMVSADVELKSGTLKHNPTGYTEYVEITIKVLSEDEGSTVDIHKAITENSSLERNLSVHGLYLNKKMPGSVILYLTSYNGNVREMLKSKILNTDFTEWLQELFNDPNIKSKLHKGKHKVEVLLTSTSNSTYREMDNTKDFSEHWKSDEYIISANRSFLMRELDVLSLNTAFAKKGKHCFSHAAMETNSERRADIFLKTLNTTMLWDMFLQILRDNKSSYILNRLNQSKKSYSAENFKLKQNILQNQLAIAEQADIESLRQVFIERHIFDSILFDEIEARNTNYKDQALAIIAKILMSGAFAMMTLVDALYISDLDNIAEKLLTNPPNVLQYKTSPIKKAKNIKLVHTDSVESIQFNGVFEVDVRCGGAKATEVKGFDHNQEMVFEEDITLDKVCEIPMFERKGHTMSKANHQTKNLYDSKLNLQFSKKKSAQKRRIAWSRNSEIKHVDRGYQKGKFWNKQMNRLTEVRPFKIMSTSSRNTRNEDVSDKTSTKQENVRRRLRTKSSVRLKSSGSIRMKRFGVNRIPVVPRRKQKYNFNHDPTTNLSDDQLHRTYIERNIGHKKHSKRVSRKQSWHVLQRRHRIMPINTDQTNGTRSTPTAAEVHAMEGYLKLKLSILKGYKERWFSLQVNGYLSYYAKKPKSPKEPPNGEMFLLLSELVTKEKYSFRLISANNLKYCLKADDAENSKQWIQAIKNVQNKLYKDTFEGLYDNIEFDSDDQTEQSKSKNHGEPPIYNSRACSNPGTDTTSFNKSEKSGFVAVGAIDFGTTYSGCAFSTTHDFKADPLRINLVNLDEGNKSYKTPTVLLLTPEGHFHLFGSKAEDYYVTLADKGEAKNWYYFDRFKMKLCTSKTSRALTSNMVIKEKGGKVMKASKVFAFCIEYIKDKLFKTIQGAIKNVAENDIKWVLTVPAIWNDQARQFMILTAEKAGIARQKLSLALEPESAAICCRHINVEKSWSTELKTIDENTKFMVVDFGGGTVDITVSQLLPTGQLKQMYSAIGGPWGGNVINDKILETFKEVIGSDEMAKFQDKDFDSYLEFEKNIEQRKRSYGLNFDADFKLEIPHDIGKSITINDKYKDLIYYRKEKIFFSSGLMKEIYRSSIDPVIKCVDEMLSKREALGVSSILLVGGYSSSEFVRNVFEEKYKEKFDIRFPLHPDMIVLKGAIITGHTKEAIVGRVAKYHYGFALRSKNICGRKISIDTEETKKFCSFITKGQIINVGQVVSEYEIKLEAKAVLAKVDIYTTEDDNPREEVDKEHFSKVGSINVKLPRLKTESVLVLIMSYDETEFKVVVNDENTGKKFLGFCKFLEKDDEPMLI